MKNLLSSLAIVVVLAALGLSTVVALPRGMDATAAAPAGAPILESTNAPAATTSVNVIAMPLNSTQQFADAGKSFDADGLAAVVGPGVQQVLTWNASTQGYRTWYPQDGEGDNFPLAVGGVYRLVLDNTAGTIVSFVGDVPGQGSVSFSLVRPAGGGCSINDISVPLDRSDLTTADQLATSVGNVQQVLEWNPTTQGYRTWYPQDGEGDNFAVKIGYPYRLCLLSSGSTVWP